MKGSPNRDGTGRGAAGEPPEAPRRSRLWVSWLMILVGVAAVGS